MQIKSYNTILIGNRSLKKWCMEDNYLFAVIDSAPDLLKPVVKLTRHKTLFIWLFFLQTEIVPQMKSMRECWAD